MAYFNHMPRTTYTDLENANNAVTLTNIFTRSSFLTEIMNNVDMHYDYQIKEFETPEIIADKLYGDPNKHWIVLMFNQILDPFYSFPLSGRELDAYILTKYGIAVGGATLDGSNTSITVATGSHEFVLDGGWNSRVVDGDAIVITSGDGTANMVGYLSSWNNTTSTMTFYCTEVVSGSGNTESSWDIWWLGASGRIHHYEQKIVRETFLNGQLQESNEDVVTIAALEWNHSLGILQTTPYLPSIADTELAAGSTTENFGSGITTVTTRTNKAISYAKFEQDRNEAKRNIKLLDRQYVSSVENEFKRLMGQN